MKKFSMFLFLILAVAICAKDLDFRVYNKNAKRSISNAEVEETVSEALNLDEVGDQYFRVGVKVYANRAGSGEDMVVYLYRKDSYTIDDYQVSVSADGTVSVTRDYVEPTLDEDNEPCGTCPDETVQVIVSTPILDPNFYLAEQNVREAEKILNEAGIKTVKLLGEDATAIDIIKNWLSCPNLKMYGRIGHGLDRTGEIVVGHEAKIGPNYWKANPGMLTEKIMMWNSCFVHSEPCKSALLNDANAYWFAAGNGVVLQAGPTKSEPVWLNWIKRSLLNGEELSAALDAAARDINYYDYGRTGNPDYGPEYYWATIVTNGITVETPNGGEELVVGSDVEISWTTNSDDAVDVELLKGGSVVETIKSSVSSSQTSITWTISESLTPGNDYKIQLTTGDTSDVSDESFTIKLKPIIKIEMAEIVDSVNFSDHATATQKLSIVNDGEGSLNYALSYKSGNSIMINEIFTPHNEFFDGFELWNRGQAMDMTGWTVEWKDSDNTSGSYDFKDGYILESGATCVLTDAQDGTDANTFYVGLNLGWSIADTVGTELSITLYDADGNGVDFVKSSGSNDMPPRGCDWTGDGIQLNQQRLYRNKNEDTDSKDDWVGGSGESSVNQMNTGQSDDGLGESWITLSSKEGSVAANDTGMITVSFSSEGLTDGETYTDTITVVHDDPDAVREIRIPVSLKVGSGVATVVSQKSVDAFGMSALANKIQYQVPTFAAGEKVTINIYSLNGRLAKVLVNDVKKSGLYTVSLGKELAAGSYICKMSTRNYQQAMMIINR